MSRHGLFVPQEFAPQGARCLETLQGLPLTEQLKRRKILSFSFRELTSGKAYLVSRLGGFEILLDSRRKMFWSVDLGHEIGHTFFFVLPKGLEMPVRSSPRYSWKKDWEENFCDWFGWQWAIAGSNHDETTRLLRSMGNMLSQPRESFSRLELALPLTLFVL